MELKELTKLLTVSRTVGDTNVEVKGVEMDTRKIMGGEVFVCVTPRRGLLKDRHDFAQEAVGKGAVALVVERDVDVDVPKIFVKDTRLALAVMATHFNDHPSESIGLIGVTGTNGKTTTSYIIDHILESAGYKNGLMGNNIMKIDGQWKETAINTQEPPDLQRNLRQMRDLKHDSCVMEVTSQGLDMKRITGCDFKTAVFTNLTQDHLDYHGTIEDYKRAKALLFSGMGNSFNATKRKHVVLNIDDEAYEYLEQMVSCEVITYGIENECDVRAKDIEITPNGMEFLLSTFKGDYKVSSPLIGRFNIYNSLAAIATCIAEGVSLEKITECLSTTPNIAGRMEVVSDNQDYTAVVDFAHTPDALENVLSSIRELSKGNILTVFGCGGDRDSTKRPIMGEVASNYSDHVIVTSDNPRTENRDRIIEDIQSGIDQQTSVNIVPDRQEAIALALRLAQAEDVVVIAGKGQESYQLINNEKLPFDDKETARKLMETVSR
ncbi:UDP-N-acetylmuramoyl-L-alanyl-D-glutamate--2,6-diaminopimelate ligase [Halalkalibacillus sediminis]|uniref:UDP-N-acetylmuramoyl-L-alanyl-D-glutamate--2,6-diaminopimelate ligase n=1 Tax=Halalkalibacillus sediminis TaxID=2018042 RepID=A0A2I0QTG4_9BACI|nr:UDP-N-acetylmuramoyl-L-alanyl-D-glutamate--2,6-diaminopimelate ligase [Halalkalibacillus sediminis]PKR77633.1 UDP-N-acetylmuramoyl-L-alanyl-D-glutamate--2,6-diaminopimelate ligase [Halalkalibacillus sediminis]